MPQNPDPSLNEIGEGIVGDGLLYRRTKTLKCFVSLTVDTIRRVDYPTQLYWIKLTWGDGLCYVLGPNILGVGKYTLQNLLSTPL